MLKLLAIAFCVMPTAVHADLSDSGSLSIGQQAVISGTVTVQGNAFSVGGSTLAVTSGKVGVGTSSPSSSLQVHNGDIRISTTTGSRGIIFQDGTTQTTAVSASTLLKSSSAYMISALSVTRTAPGVVDAAFSTLTLTGFSGSERARICIHCNWGGSTADQRLFFGYLLDGALAPTGVPAAPTISSTLGIAEDQEESGSAREKQISRCALTPTTLSAGSHTFAALWWTGSLTMFINQGGQQVCEFSVEIGPGI